MQLALLGLRVQALASGTKYVYPYVRIWSVTWGVFFHVQIGGWEG